MGNCRSLLHLSYILPPTGLSLGGRLYSTWFGNFNSLPAWWSWLFLQLSNETSLRSFSSAMVKQISTLFCGREAPFAPTDIFLLGSKWNTYQVLSTSICLTICQGNYNRVNPHLLSRDSFNVGKFVNKYSIFNPNRTPKLHFCTLQCLRMMLW